MLVQPYTKMFIFVDFNERNIILENSETEIGDIRRRTTEVLLEVGCKYLDKRGTWNSCYNWPLLILCFL